MAAAIEVCSLNHWMVIHTTLLIGQFRQGSFIKRSNAKIAPPPWLQPLQIYRSCDASLRIMQSDILSQRYEPRHNASRRSGEKHIRETLS